MLLVTVDVLKNALTPDQKDLLVKRITAALVEVEGENIRQLAWVRFNEFENGDWAIGGRRMSVHDVLEIKKA